MTDDNFAIILSDFDGQNNLRNSKHEASMKIQCWAIFAYQYFLTLQYAFFHAFFFGGGEISFHKHAAVWIKQDTVVNILIFDAVFIFQVMFDLKVVFIFGLDFLGVTFNIFVLFIFKVDFILRRKAAQ